MNIKKALALGTLLIATTLSLTACNPLASGKTSQDRPAQVASSKSANTDPSKGWVVVQKGNSGDGDTSASYAEIAKKCDGSKLMYVATLRGQGFTSYSSSITVVANSSECQK